MTVQDMRDIIAQGENSSVEFKDAQVRSESLARELTAFANGSGGVVIIGVSDTGELQGIDPHRDYEQLTINAAGSAVVPALDVNYQQISI